jgi:TolB-like protein
MRIIVALRLALLLGTTASCAPSLPPLARLEAAREAAPRSAAVHRSLGVAYYRAGRLLEARAALAEARRLEPRDGVAALYAGLVAERLGDVAAAREAYASYLVVGRTSHVRGQLRERLAVLNRQALEAATKDAVAREQELAAVPGAPTTIAVLPFTFSGADGSLAPIGRGLAELVVVDLARAPELTILERARVQALLDEIALSDSAAAESATRARAGRILRAGRLVSGARTRRSSTCRRRRRSGRRPPTTASPSSSRWRSGSSSRCSTRSA